MIRIDGSHGEGGGAVLRVSVALSALTGTPVKITNIRAKRPNPGLRAQHLSAIKAVGKLTNAEVDGLAIGSKEITFTPNEIEGGKLSIDIGTAGSITLVLQALLISAANSKKEIRVAIRGGTDVRWSPPIDYLAHVMLPILARFGYDAEVELVKRGYYPAGGGEVNALIRPNKIKEINLTEFGKVKEVCGTSHAHIGLEKAQVARRQARSARPLLFNRLSKLGFDSPIDIKDEYVDALSYGSGITLWVKTDNSVIGADALGEKGKRAQEVGAEAAKRMVDELNTIAPLDRYMADQIVPFLAIAGGSVRVSQVTEHTRTNVSVVNEFGYNVQIEDNILHC